MGTWLNDKKLKWDIILLLQHISKSVHYWLQVKAILEALKAIIIHCQKLKGFAVVMVCDEKKESNDTFMRT